MEIRLYSLKSEELPLYAYISACGSYKWGGLLNEWPISIDKGSHHQPAKPLNVKGAKKEKKCQKKQSKKDNEKE